MKEYRKLKLTTNDLSTLWAYLTIVVAFAEFTPP
jgi:hypothetical protein